MRPWMQSRAWITQNFKVSKNLISYFIILRSGVFVAVSVWSSRFEGQCFSLSQESAYMFRYQKADPGGHLRRRRIIHLRQAEGAIIHLLATQSRGLSLPSEAACPLTFLHLRHHLPRDEPPILNVATASETATEWLIFMRNSEPVRTAPQATMIGVLSPPLRLLPQHWLENVLEWGHLTLMSDAPSLLLLHPTWPGTVAPLDEPPFHLRRQQVTGTPMSGPDSLRCLELRCILLHAPGSPCWREYRRHHSRHLAMQAIRCVIQGENQEWMCHHTIIHTDV